MSVILSTLYSLVTYSSYITSLLLGFVVYAVIRWSIRRGDKVKTNQNVLDEKEKEPLKDKGIFNIYFIPLFIGRSWCFDSKFFLL